MWGPLGSEQREVSLENLMLHRWSSQSLQDALGPTPLVVAALKGQIPFDELLRYCPEDLLH